MIFGEGLNFTKDFIFFNFYDTCFVLSRKIKLTCEIFILINESCISVQFYFKNITQKKTVKR